LVTGTDHRVCFRCKQPGHIADNCPLGPEVKQFADPSAGVAPGDEDPNPGGRPRSTQVCRFDSGCTRADCWFTHPSGRNPATLKAGWAKAEAPGQYTQGLCPVAPNAAAQGSEAAAAGGDGGGGGAPQPTSLLTVVSKDVHPADRVVWLAENELKDIPEELGTVKSFTSRGENRYGFVIPDGDAHGGRDLFLHANQIVDKNWNPIQGERVSYKYEERNGKPQAKCVKLVFQVGTTACKQRLVVVAGCVAQIDGGAAVVVAGECEQRGAGSALTPCRGGAGAVHARRGSKCQPEQPAAARARRRTRRPTAAARAAAGGRCLVEPHQSGQDRAGRRGRARAVRRAAADQEPTALSNGRSARGVGHQPAGQSPAEEGGCCGREVVRAKRRREVQTDDGGG